jgi:Spy/CpxP family protein refolding chaperone
MRYPRLFLVFITVLLAFSGAAFGQGAPAQENSPDEQTDGNRPNLFAELGLSPEQRQQIRRINQERRPRMIEARMALGEAQRKLDMAIYADGLNEADVQTRLREFQRAEAELARLRFESELSIRKVLTPEQLVRFRDIRRQFAEERRRNVNQRRMNRRRNGMPRMQDRPIRRPID